MQETGTCEVDSVVIPGDVALTFEVDSKTKIIVGPGLRVSGNQILVTKCGRLRKKSPNTYWVDNVQKRYVPVRGETVVGIVTSKLGDYFKVDIGSSDLAQLSYLAFEGVTKKNRPNVNVGDVVCAQLVVANRDMDPELVCVDSYGKKGLLGVLNDGFLFTVSLNLARKILHLNCPLLETFQKRLQVPFEIAVGMNGFIWIKTKRVDETIALANAILAAEFKTASEMRALCEDIGNILAGL